MPDGRFFITSGPLPVAAALDIALGPQDASESGVVRSTSVDPENAAVRRVCAVEDHDLAGAVVYADSKTAVSLLGKKEFALCFATPTLADMISHQAGGVAAVEDPKLAFAKIARHLHTSIIEETPPKAGIASDAEINPSAVLAEDVVIGAKARIAADVVIGPGAVIGPGVEIGPGSKIGPRAVLSHCVLGSRVVIAPGAVIGEAGFGFHKQDGQLFRMPQLGIVTIDDEAEIGANTTIDRAALGETVIGAGAKIDNLVQIGHNVRIGRGAILASQVGIAGSTIIGDNVLIGGQAGLADHLTIGDGAMIAAGTGLMRDVLPGERVGGFPGRPIRAWLRDVARMEKEDAARYGDRARKKEK